MTRTAVRAAMLPAAMVVTAMVLLVGCGPDARTPTGADQLTGIEQELDAIESEINAPAG